MTKKKFLSELEKKLSVLDDSEIKDIVNEYSDIIDEKVKHGKTEKEAIADFGKLDDLAKEILSAYKINPNYKEGTKDEFEASAKKLSEDFDDFIKKGADKASKATKKVMEQVKENEQEFTIEFVFELLFKAIAALLLCVVVSIPISIVRRLGESLLHMFMTPIAEVFIVLFNIALGVLFLIFCGFIFVAMFKQYVTPKKKEKIEKKENEVKMEESKKEEAKEAISETKREEKRERQLRRENSLSTVFITILKIFIIFFVLVPIWFMIVGIGICLAFVVFGLIKGIFYFGPFLLCVGGICILSEISSLIYRVVFTNKKPRFYGIVIGLICLIIGTFLTIDLVFHFQYINEAPTGLEKDTYETTLQITEPSIIDYDYRMKYREELDPTLEDGKLVLEITYYKDIYQQPTVEKEGELSNYDVLFESNRRVDFEFHYDMVIEDLRKNQLHDYRQLEDFEVTVKGNEKTLDMISFAGSYDSSYYY